MLYEPIGPKQANKFSTGDKYDKSVESVIASSNAKTFIVEKVETGFVVSIAKECVPPVQEPIVKEATHGPAVIKRTPETGRGERTSSNSSRGRRKKGQH